MWFLKCTLGNINIGGTRLPKAFTATIIVTFIPLSPDVTLPTCLIPLAQIILGERWTVELIIPFVTDLISCEIVS
jgi:hypothetical protein